MTNTSQPGQVTGNGEYEYNPIFTVGETINGYTPPGILDGLGAFELDDNTVRVLANHELRPGLGYAYELANGTQLQGARVSYFDINKETFEIEDTGLAYDTIINRQGEVVDDPTDLEFGGISRLCSSIYIEPQQFGEGIGLENGIYFTGEESSQGTEYALDPVNNVLYAAPWMGRAAWENVTELNTGSTEKVAILVGDDREAAPLLLYVGEKDRSEDAGFLERNGLVGGKVYAWVPDGEVGDTPEFVDEDGDVVDADTAPDPAGFNGTGNSLSGQWVELDHYRPDLASVDGSTGYDADGFATQEKQDALFIEAGGFQFSRPEDVATNPEDGTEAVLASTGRGGRFPEDNWGTTYIIDTHFDENGDPVSAEVSIIYDSDDAGNGQFEHPDFGLRSPDNLDWADDGQIYLQEDRSTVERVPTESVNTDEEFPDAFGGVSREEASIWELDPDTGELTRIAQVDRSAVPEGQIDTDPDDLGDWETSGILDVSNLFGQQPGSLLIADAQSHSLRGGPIGDPDVASDDPTSDDQNLVQGGQLFFITEAVAGTDGDDVLTGLNIAQTIAGNLGNDTIFGGDSDDILRGDLNQRASGSEGGDDVIFGGAGDDRIGGKVGNDELFGDEGHDSLWGDDGDDILRGGLGNDILVGDDFSGGSGSDTFILAMGEGTDIIVDFEVGVDFIGLAEGLTPEQLAIAQVSGNTEISVANETLAILSQVDAETLMTNNPFVSI